jgi:tellurite resistance-related uncharacterized protein
MSRALELPGGVELVRVAGPFDEASVPGGLLKAHRVAAGTWGRINVIDGRLRFVWEDDGASVDLPAGSHQVIPPDAPHRVELCERATFTIEFFTTTGA